MYRAVLWWNWSAASAALASVWEEGKSTTWVCSSCDWPRTGLLLKTAGYTWVLTLNSRLRFKLNWWVLIGGICAQLQILNDLSGALTDKCLQVSAVRRHRCNQSSRNVDITGEVQTSVSRITLNMIDLWMNCPEVASPNWRRPHKPVSAALITLMMARNKQEDIYPWVPFVCVNQGLFIVCCCGTCPSNQTVKIIAIICHPYSYLGDKSCYNLEIWGWCTNSWQGRK